MICHSCSRYTPDESAFCQHCGSPIRSESKEEKLRPSAQDTLHNAAFLSRLDHIEQKLNSLERERASRPHDRDQELPRTSLLSTSLLKRAFTVWGHLVLAQFIIALPIWLILLLTMVSS